MNTPQRPVDKKLLGRLHPLAELSPEGLDELAAKTTVEQLPASRQLFVQGKADNWTFYLLAGAVELSDTYGRRETVKANTVQALSPLAPAAPRRMTATALTPVDFIRIDNDLLEVLSATGSGQIEVDEIEAQDEAMENRIFYQLYQDFLQNRIELPSIPDVALHVHRAVQDPDCDIVTIARIVQSDPAVAARLVQVANSPLYLRGAPAGSCRAAISRLGLNTTRNLVTAFSMQQLFKSRHAALRQRMTALWQHSARVAAIGFVLARKTPGIDPDRALLAGLLHDLGALPVLAQAERYPELIAQPEELDAVIDNLRGQLGAMALRQWKMPTDLVAVALECEMWDRDPDPRVDLCDVILIAQLHSFIGTPRMHGCPRIDAIPAFAKLALGRLTPQLSLELLEQSKEEINQMLQLLQG